MYVFAICSHFLPSLAYWSKRATVWQPIRRLAWYVSKSTVQTSFLHYSSVIMDRRVLSLSLETLITDANIFNHQRNLLFSNLYHFLTGRETWFSWKSHIGLFRYGGKALHFSKHFSVPCLHCSSKKLYPYCTPNNTHIYFAHELTLKALSPTSYFKYLRIHHLHNKA